MSARLTIDRGAHFGPQVINVVDSAAAAVDLTGWSVYAQARQTPGAELAFDLGPEITDAAGGEVSIEMTYAETAELPAGTFQWDLILENAAGVRIKYLARSTIVVSGTITQV